MGTVSQPLGSGCRKRGEGGRAPVTWPCIAPMAPPARFGAADVEQPRAAAPDGRSARVQRLAGWAGATSSAIIGRAAWGAQLAAGTVLVWGYGGSRLGREALGGWFLRLTPGRTTLSVTVRVAPAQENHAALPRAGVDNPVHGLVRDARGFLMTVSKIAPISGDA